MASSVIMVKLIALTLFISGCASSVKVIHRALDIPVQCEFLKFTAQEKATMSQAVGRKIFKNQETCRIRQTRIDKLIETHNKAHAKK